MKKTLYSVAKYLLGLISGVALFWYAFRDRTLDSLLNDLSQANIYWMLAALVVAAFSHLLRAIAWRMQLRAAGYSPSVLNTFASVMFMYLANQVLPRAGELARCSVLLKSDKVPIATSFGTVVVSRVLDMVMLFIFLGVIFGLEYDTLMGYMAQFMAKKANGETDYTLLYVLGGVLIVLAGMAWLLRDKLLRIPLVQKLWNFVTQLIDSALSIRNLQSPILFVLSSIAIWLMYWLNTYVGFYCFSRILAFDINYPYFALIATIMGGLGMAFPVPGGIGPYHTALIYTFTGFLAGMTSKEEAEALGQSYAILMHTSQFVMFIIVGGISYLYLVLQTPKDSAMQPAN